MILSCWAEGLTMQFVVDTIILTMWINTNIYVYIYIYNLAMAYMYIYIHKIWLWLQTHDSAQWGFKKTPIDPITPSVCSGKAHGSPPPPEI